MTTATLDSQMTVGGANRRSKAISPGNCPFGADLRWIFGPADTLR